MKHRCKKCKREWICFNEDDKDCNCDIAYETNTCPTCESEGTDEGSEGSGDGLSKAVNEPES